MSKYEAIKNAWSEKSAKISSQKEEKSRYEQIKAAWGQTPAVQKPTQAATMPVQAAQPAATPYAQEPETQKKGLLGRVLDWGKAQVANAENDTYGGYAVDPLSTDAIYGERRAPSTPKVVIPQSTDTATGRNAAKSSSYSNAASEAEQELEQTEYTGKYKEELQAERDALLEEYNELNNRFMWGRIGKDYAAEDADKLVEMEQQLQAYAEQISAAPSQFNGQDTRNGFQRAIDRILGADPSKVTGGDTDWGTMLKGVVSQGLNQWNALNWKTAKAYLGGLMDWEPVRFMVGGFADEMNALATETINGVISALNYIPNVNLGYIDQDSILEWGYQDAQAGLQQATEKYEANANTSRAAQIVNNFGTATVAALPMALEAVLLKPYYAAKAAIGAGSKGLEYFSGLQSASGLEAAGMMAKEGLTKLLRNPQFWTSYIQVAGDGYEDALEDGMSEEDAKVYGLVNGFFNAMIEIGGADDTLGGIQNFPMRLEQMKQAGGKHVLVEWFKDAMLGEAKEEVEQGAFERGLKALFGQDVPLLSIEPNDQSAIFNPVTAAQEFAGGAVVGGLLGGAEAGVSKIGRSLAESTVQTEEPAAPEVRQAREIASGEGGAQENESGKPERKTPVTVEGVDVSEAERTTTKPMQPRELPTGKAPTQADDPGRPERMTPVEKPAAEKTGESSESESIESFSETFDDPEKVTEIYNQAADTDVDEFAAGFRAAYDMGRSGVSDKYLDGTDKDGEPYVRALTDEQRKAAYELGRSDAANAAQKRSQTAINKQQAGSNLSRVTGTVKGEGVDLAKLRDTFNDKQRIAYRVLSRYAETSGVNIVLYDSQPDAETGLFPDAQGRFQWKDDTIYIDINSGLFSKKDVGELGKYTMLRTFSHEFTHFVEKWNAVRYNEFREFVFQALEGKGENVHDLIESKQALVGSTEMTYEQASREVIADAMMDILPDSQLVQQLAQERPNLFRRLLQKMRAFTAKIRQYYREISTKAPREAEVLKENGRYMESVVRMWDEIAKGAVENYQRAAGDVLIDQPAKPEGLKRQKTQQAKQTEAQPQTKRAGMDFFKPVEDAEEKAPDLRSRAAQRNKPVSRERFPANDLTSQAEEAPRLRERAPKAEKEEDDFSDVNPQEVREELARAGIVNGELVDPEKLEQASVVRQAREDAKKQKEARKEIKANERTKEPAAEAPDVRAETGDRRDGTGAVRVPAEREAGDVQTDAAGREPDSVSPETGNGTGRHGDRPDAERNGRSGSEGSRESGVQPGRDGLTEEEHTRQAEELHETAEHDVAEKSTEAPGGNNYQIEKSLDLPNGSKARFRANVDAIRLVKQLETEHRNATAEEQAVLARYVGWGGIPEAFDERKGEWSKEYAELKELLTDEEYKAAKGSTLNAHYTSIPVIRAMYRGLEKLGFKGGRMLEPSSGVGNFVGAMPADMTAKVRSWTMVELDNITGLIAKHLYPHNDVRIEGFEKTVLPDNYMDVAIGNVPFGNYPVVDRAYPKKLTAAIHNYFFAKSLDKVRPGGIVMFITSSYTMNSNDQTVRKYIARKADLLGAIRLPNTAFSGNAATSVVTDILVLKKRAPGTAYAGVPFIETPYDYKFGYQNEYFKANPEMVCGKEVTTRGMHYRDEYSVDPDSSRGSLEEQIDKAFGNISGKMDYTAAPNRDETNKRVMRAEKGTKQGGYVQKEGKIYQNDGGELKEVQTDEKTAKRITGMLGIRDLSRQLLNAQQMGLGEDSIKANRRSLNKAYDSFVKEYGFLNSAANRKAFADDPDRFSLFALENWDAEKKTATKADIFKVDTIRPNQTITHADTVKDAVAICRNTIGNIDVQVIAQLTGKSQADVTRELIESELAFKTTGGTLEPAEAYLSGNVRAKLRDAQGLVGLDKDYQHNVDALKRIVPADIPHEQIFVQPGTPWIPESVYSDFAAYILGGNNHRYYGGPDVQIHRSNQTGTFTIDLNNKRLKTGYQNTQEWGTPKRSFLNLLEAMMNSRSVTVTYKDAEGHTIVDRVATDAANEKIEQITKKFQEWMWADEERTKDLEYLYNETFNNLVTPKYDGSTLTVNGLRAGWNLKPHQADAVQRIVSSGGNTLIAHKVGAGKTMEMAAAAMKMKELGIVQKPMFAVPKSLVAQWGKEFTTYFPAAKILVAEQSDFTPANRKTFANRIATGNYDAIIVSYEQFEKIPISDSFALSLYQEQIDEIIQAINEAKEESGKNSMSVKDMEKKRKQLEAKVQKLTDKAKDTDSIEFEQLGIDSIFVDEAHNFKNLFYTTSMNNVAGLGNRDGSKRAFDLYTKVRYLQQLNGGRGIVFATATPVMNSMSEMYIMQKYLQPNLLDQLGLSTFDAWAKQFGEVVNGVEIKPSGQGYRVKQSFSRFKNMSELQLLFRNFSDVLTQVPGLKIPKMKGGAVKVVECEPGEFQKSYMEALTKRADNIKNVDPSKDNMLKITSDGRKISYTQRMIDPSLPYEEGCKIYRCAENIAEEYKTSKAVKGTQIIFCDMATPKGKSNNTRAAVEEDIEMDADSAQLYNDLKARLVKLGIPAKEIAFIHDADTDAKKTKLFADMNDGKVRVLIGSTGKMGVGMNAQKRVVAIHHLDAPWRPGDVEQRDGRAFRQGNINEEVSKYVYVTKGSFDARLWDIIDRKSGFIGPIMNGENVGREVEDTGEVTLSAAEVKALASGSPLILEQVQLETDIKKLQNLYMAHRQSVVEAGKKLQEAKQAKAEAEARAAADRKDSKTRTAASTDEAFSMKVGNGVYTDKKKAGAALMAQATAKATEETYTKIGSFAGFDILVMQTKEGIIGLLKADGAYKFHTYPDNTTLMITNMQKVLNGLDKAAEAHEELARQKAQEIKAQEAMMQAPFPRQAELDQKRQRYNEVMEELNPKEEQAMSDEDDGTVEYSLRGKPIPSRYEREKDNIHVVDIRSDKNGTFQEQRAEITASEIRDSLIKEPVLNKDTGENLFILPKTLSHSFSNRGWEQLQLVRNMRAVLENAILTHREDSRKAGDDSTTGVYKFFAAVRTNNGVTPVKITVKEYELAGQALPANVERYLQNNPQADTYASVYDGKVLIVEGIEKETSSSAASSTQGNPAPDNHPSVSDISIKELFSLVKGEDRKYLPQEVEESTRQQNSLSDREVLSMAAQKIDVENLTDVEKNALDIFNQRLTRLEEAQEQRAELGRQYKEQQFTKGGSRAEADKIRAAMSVWDSKIKRLENSLLSLENKDVLKSVLQKARRVVELEERKRGDETLKKYRERRNESTAARKYRARVVKEAETLREWMVKPSNKDIRKHVPAEIQKTVADYLDSIVLLSKTALATGGAKVTKADEKYLKNMQNLHDAIKENVDTSGQYSGYNDLPPDFMETFEALLRKTEEYMRANNGVFVVNQMKAAELRQLAQTLRTLRKFIVTMNSFHNNAVFQHAYDAGEETISHLALFRKSTESGTAYKFMRFDYMRPSYAFEHFGKGGQSIEHEFREGQATQAFLANKIIDFARKTYNGEEVREWSEETKSFTLSDGETVTMPVTHLMSLYCLNKRPQAVTHIYGDGIRVANYKADGKVQLDEGHIVSIDDVTKMIQELTPRQREVADALQRYMSTECAAWGNHVSMARFDVEQFGEDNYFPINSDGRYLPATADESPDNAGLYALLNMGFTKELKENAKNRIILYNIFDVFANHTASMTQYRAFALPVLDALKWFNYKNDSTSVRTKLSSAFGAPVDERAGSGSKGYAEGFVLNLIRAYNGTAANGDAYDSGGLKALHRFNRAQIAFNLRVVIQQPTAVTRAAMILSPAKLMKGLGMSAVQLGKLADEMEAHSGIAAWKRLGFYDTNISRGLTELIKQNPSFGDKVTELGTKGAEAADRFTWAAMWYAAKGSVNRSAYESEEAYFKAVTELFEDVIYKTQVVDSVLTKSEYLRAKGFFPRMMGSFMSEPMTTVSMLTDAYFKYSDDMQRGMSRGEAWKRNGKNITKTAAVYAVGQVILAAAQAIIDAWRDDDEYDTENWFSNYFQKYLQAFKDNIVDELMPFGKIPIVSEFYEASKSLMDYAGLFDKWGLDLYGNDISNGWAQYAKYLMKASEITIDKVKGNKTNYTWYGAIYNLLRGVSGLVGLPMATTWREVQDILNNTLGYFAPRFKLDTYQRAIDRKYAEIVRPTGLAQKTFEQILSAADTDGNGSLKQDELGAELVAEIGRGEITEAQAAAVWKTQWNKDNSKTFAEWRSGKK